MTKKKVFPQKSEPEFSVYRDRLYPVTIRTDPFGSYTGVPFDKLELPVQDADDL